MPNQISTDNGPLSLARHIHRENPSMLIPSSTIKPNTHMPEDRVSFRGTCKNFLSQIRSNTSGLWSYVPFIISELKRRYLFETVPNNLTLVDSDTDFCFLAKLSSDGNGGIEVREILRKNVSETLFNLHDKRWIKQKTRSTMASNLYLAFNFDMRSVGERLKEIMRTRTAPTIIVKQGLENTIAINEAKARTLLCLLIGKELYQRYLAKGFLNIVTNKFRYQIFSGKQFTYVYNFNGKIIDRLCIHLDGDYAPTDEVIMKVLMLKHDEDEAWKIANKHGVVKSFRPSPSTDWTTNWTTGKSLVDVLKQLKQEAEIVS